MKRNILITSLLVLAFAFTNCKKDDTSTPTGGIPDNIVIDIPSSISSSLKAAPAGQDTSCIAISGDSIYENIKTFIAFGEFSAKFVEDIIVAIKKYQINKPMDVSYISDEDGKTKNLVVIENGTYNGKTYEMKLSLTDVESGMKAMQVFWNKTQVEGIAIVSPKYFDTSDETLQLAPKLMYRVEYSSIGTSEYDKKMVVSISGNPIQDTYGIDNLKMQVTKKGDIVTITGNSNHPEAKFFDPANTGFSYAFVAKGDVINNIGCINLALAPCTTSTNDVLTTHSVEKAVQNELNYFVTLAGQDTTAEPYKSCIEEILSNCKSPAYYKSSGYVTCGSIAPTGADYSKVSNLEGLTPYAPADIDALAVTFGE